MAIAKAGRKQRQENQKTKCQTNSAIFGKSIKSPRKKSDVLNQSCIKSSRIWSFYSPHFHNFGLNGRFTE